MTPPVAAVFEETQWFWRRWWWLLLAFTLLLVGVIIPALHRPQGPQALFIALPLALPALALVWLLRLKVRVDAAGIHYQYLPFLHRWRHWPWSEFQEVALRTYSPLGDYGGWGIRGLPGNMAYNVWGPHGLQLIFRSGNKLLLGTQHPEELRAVLAALQARDASRPIEI